MHKGRAKRSLLIPPLIIILSGSGTLMGGTTQTISVATVPSSATLTTVPSSGQFTTPASLELERKNSYTLVATRDGYTEARAQLQRKMRTGPLLADIFLTGLLGVIVDAATGGWYQLTPENVTISLEQLDPAMPGPDRIEGHIGQCSEEAGTFVIHSDEPVNLEVIQN